MSNSSWTNGQTATQRRRANQSGGECGHYELESGGTRRDIRGALAAGATREEILMVLKIASLLSIHTASLGAPILLEEAKAAGVKPAPKAPAVTPVCDGMKAAGQWNTAWDGFFDLYRVDRSDHRRESPGFHQRRIHSQAGGVLLSIAVDASITDTTHPEHAGIFSRP